MTIQLLLGVLLSMAGLTSALSNRTTDVTATTLSQDSSQHFHLRGVTTALQDDPLNSILVEFPRDYQDHRRHLQAVHEHRNFRPLECNAIPCNLGSIDWSDRNYRPDTQTVEIPCGWCVTMDHVGGTLSMPFGLDIQGTLIFPDGYAVTIETPFVRVQGVLQMTATQPVTGEPGVRILLTGEDEDLTSFVPADENEFRCSDMDATVAKPCDVGSKPIVVAGGRLDIHGLKDTCKTWLKLEDLVGQSTLAAPSVYTKLPEPTPKHANLICRSLDPYMSESFVTNDNSYGWTGGYGAPFKIMPIGSFKVTGRKSALDHGPTWDMLNMRDCLIPNQTYLFSARVRLSKKSSAGTPSSCATDGSGCLTLRSTTKLENGQVGSRVGYEVPSDGFVYGVFKDFYATFSFTAEELDPDAVFQVLQFEGPDADIGIEIDDIVFSLPPKETVPDPENVCSGNLIMNGGASASNIHPYPIESFGGNLEVRTGVRANNFFRTAQRSSDIDSLAYSMDAPGCMVTGANYLASARLRIQSDNEVSSAMVLRVFFEDKASTKHVMATCPPSSRNWVTCESEFAMVEDLDPTQVKSIRLSFETTGGNQDILDVDDWELSFQQGPRDALVVQEDGVAGCWDDGAEILITSHTTHFENEQVRRILGSPQSLGNGFVQLNLNEPIVPTVTRLDSEDFAVEVALLSRNIVFEGATDEADALLGGHLIVLHTPTVTQTLQGVELSNFGRQGELGRYPIHFHLSSNVDGAVVEKNTIRASNQRCVVVHGTHNLTIADNVAFDTMGHCYMTEDGGEIDNKFLRNLGALTRTATRKVRPVETDTQNPSTFWCSNPANEWVGNVAAGCESNGFWFELQDDVRSPTSEMPLSAGMNPKRLALKLFVDNVSHSNRKHGLRTYPHGFLPPKQAIFDNTKSYKNQQDGIFFHNSQDLTVRGGILADNRIGADFDKADNILIDGTSVIGVTAGYREIADSQVGTYTHDNTVVGLELHGFATDTSLGGASIRGVSFSGFSDTRSTRTALIQIDNEKWTGNFDFWTTIEDVTIEDNVTPLQFYFSDATEVGIEDIYLTDLDSSMKPFGSDASGTSSVVSDSTQMTTFLEPNSCEAFPDRGFLYCRDTCLRTFTFATSPTNTDSHVLRVTDRSNPGSFFDYPGRYNYERDENKDLDEMSNTEIRKHRYFSVSLPNGDYSAEFLDRNLETSWPTFVETTVESPQCTDSLALDGISLEMPTATRGECRELIKNGDMDARTASYPYWLHNGVGIEVIPGAGIGSTNAIADKDQSSATGYIGQFIDARCLEEGSTYELRAMVKLERSGGAAFVCDGSNCPTIRLRSQYPVDEGGGEFATTVATAFVRPVDDSGWNLLQGSFTIDSRIAASPIVSLTVQRGLTGARMFLDNVSMTRIDKQCDELVFNGDFADGTSAFWEKDGTANSDLEMTLSQGSSALQMVSRSSGADSMVQNIETGCMTQGNRYVAKAKIRLVDSNGGLFNCDTTMRSGNAVCPRMKLRSFVDNAGVAHYGGSIATTDHGVTSDGWRIISGVFEATSNDELADKSTLSFIDAPQGKDLVIDNVSITPLQMSCNELILNGDAEYGETPSFWRQFSNDDGTKIEIVTLSGGNQAFKISNRPNAGDGLSQRLDSRCLKQVGDRYKLTARVKIESGSTGAPVVCDPADTRAVLGCPPVRIIGFENGTKVQDARFYTDPTSSWSADGFNNYEVEFTVSDALTTCDVVSIAIRNYNVDWDITIDDISVTPVVV